MFEALKLKFAAKRYARKLRFQLTRDYGGSGEYDPSATYTVPQIQRAILAANLDPKYIALAYATFLSKEAFDSLREQMPVKLTYEDARAMFVRFEPIVLTSETSPAGKMGVGLGSDGFPN
jgi:hypothetical protein